MLTNPKVNEDRPKDLDGNELVEGTDYLWGPL